ncbi:MAG: hypothetical protein H6661_10235 [Ardenticatenaceae bacterium]|nr:hypothetical protein [Ardenticatenaceae bacterium]
MRELIGLIIFFAALALLHPRVGEWLETHLDRIDIRSDLGALPGDDQ